MNQITNSYKLVENKSLEITLSDDEAAALKALESKITNFVSGLPDDKGDEEDTRFKILFQKSEIRENTYFLTVNNAIGQIVLGNRVFNISPKIDDIPKSLVNSVTFNRSISKILLGQTCEYEIV